MRHVSTVPQVLVRVPDYLIQAGLPLKVSLYQYSSSQKKIVKCATQGEVLGLDIFLSLVMNRMVAVFVDKLELAEIVKNKSNWENQEEEIVAA